MLRIFSLNNKLLVLDANLFEPVLLSFSNTNNGLLGYGTELYLPIIFRFCPK